MFYAWLMRQRHRNDAVGFCASFAESDPRWPRNSRKLYVLLFHLEGRPDVREWLKIAHREWRSSR